MSTPGTPVAAGHIGLCPGLVDEDETRWIKSRLRLEPCRSRRGDIGTILLNGRQCLFLSVILLALRDVIEITRSHDLERGIFVGIHNNHGPTWRGMTDGGAQERERAKYYRKCSEETVLEWPRTSAMLEQIAKSYEHKGGWEDDNAERRDW